MTDRLTRAGLISRIVLGALFLITVLFAWLVARFLIDYGRRGGFRPAPAIAEGIDFGTGPWTQRLRMEFPIGDSERRLVRVLEDQGFDVDVRRREATYKWGAGIPCDYTLSVTWTVNTGREIRTLDGVYDNACL